MVVPTWCPLRFQFQALPRQVGKVLVLEVQVEAARSTSEILRWLHQMAVVEAPLEMA
jgi:hypothetical protein